VKIQNVTRKKNEIFDFVHFGRGTRATATTKAGEHSSPKRTIYPLESRLNISKSLSPTSPLYYFRSNFHCHNASHPLKNRRSSR
jgi:hypothetical protein